MFCRVGPLSLVMMNDLRTVVHCQSPSGNVSYLWNLKDRRCLVQLDIGKI